MEGIEILSSGKKIKKIRKELGLKQYEIAAGEITRNLISIIENDKAALTKKAAKIIATNINKVCEERNIEYHVSMNYLLEDENRQAIKVVDKYLEKIAVDNLEIIDDVEEFLIRYDVGDKKKVIYEKIGDIYNEIKDYYKSYTYYLKAYESIKKSEINDEIALLILKLSICCKLSNKYKEALEFNNIPLNNENKISGETTLSLLINKVDILKMLKKYEEALEFIEFIEEKLEETDPVDLFQLFTLKGQCFKESNHYKDALEVQKKLKDMCSNDINKTLLINCNIIDIYKLLKDNKNIRKYIEESIKIIDNPKDLYKDSNITDVFIKIATGCKYIGEIDLAIEYYNHGIYSAKRNKNYKLLLMILEDLFDIYIKENNVDEIDNIKNQLLEILTLDISLKGNDLIFKFIGFYNNINDKDSINSIISFILE